MYSLKINPFRKIPQEDFVKFVKHIWCESSELFTHLLKNVWVVYLSTINISQLGLGQIAGKFNSNLKLRKDIFIFKISTISRYLEDFFQTIMFIHTDNEFLAVLFNE